MLATTACGAHLIKEGVRVRVRVRVRMRVRVRVRGRVRVRVSAAHDLIDRDRLAPRELRVVARAAPLVAPPAPLVTAATPLAIPPARGGQWSEGEVGEMGKVQRHVQGRSRLHLVWG